MDHTTHHLTGLRLEITATAPVPPSELWSRIADVGAIGAWSPECLGATWIDGAVGAAPGARFSARNRFGTGDDSIVLTASGVVTEVVADRSFAWSMLDDDGLVGSFWRYDLSPAAAGTLVRHAWEHGPGATGMRDNAVADPSSVDRRLGALASHMHATLMAMTNDVLGQVA